MLRILIIIIIIGRRKRTTVITISPTAEGTTSWSRGGRRTADTLKLVNKDIVMRLQKVVCTASKNTGTHGGPIVPTGDWLYVNE